MRFVQLVSAEGRPCYVDLDGIDAIGPSMLEADKRMRVIYLRGGQCLAVLDTTANMNAIFETSSGRPS